MKSRKQTNRAGFKRSETLLEVLLAIVVLIIGAATATSLIITAMKANAFNKDSLIALNLAQEGVEYMRNLRDTNWIRFSANREGCWNMKPGDSSCNPLTDLLTATGAGTGYALGDSLTGVVSSTLDLSDGVLGAEANYNLKYYDLNTLENSDGKDIEDSGSKPEKEDDYDFVGSAPVSGSFVDDSKFYRRIEIEYFTIGPAPGWALTSGATPQAADLMMVTSTVQWMDASILHQINLKSALASYKQ